jgi:serine/threonine protein kinase/Tfp pilus assembly protein PilF
MNPADEEPEDRQTIPDELETIAVRGGSGPRQPTDPARLPGSIAGYRIAGLLGEGAMGVVYEAEQQHTNRRVAIKVMHRFHLVDDLHARMFQREVETLGRLKHANIAAIYESGHTEDGRDFFAMELVRGLTLDRWLADRPSPVTEEELKLRLRLFSVLCQAVHYAHQRGVIHRDLKPANILVVDEQTSISGSGQTTPMPTVKILDFGLARITDQDVLATMATEVGMIKGTLPYMSPEQARGESDAVDVRTDIYALGVMLYELVAGQRPYETVRAALAEAIRVICEVPPRPLRQSWSGVGRLDIDVENIVGKALEKEPARRYASAAALAEDIERYLSSQPINARPPNALYQIRKFARRNRALVGSAAAALLVLVLFTATMAVQSGRIRTERDRANREAGTAREVTDFMVELFRGSDPGETKGKELSARELLDRGSQRIEELADRPLTQATLMETIGRVYYVMGAYHEAAPLLEKAVAIREQHADDELSLAASLQSLALLLDLRGDPGMAEEPIRRAVDIRRRLLGPGEELAESLNTLGNVLWHTNRLDEAEAVHRQALEMRERVYPPEPAMIAQSLHNIGALRYFDGDLNEAERLWRRSAEIEEEVGGPDSWGLATSLHCVAIVCNDEKRYDEALVLEERALAIREKVLGPGHPHVALSLNTMGDIYCGLGRPAEAEKMIRRAVGIAEAAWGPQHGELWWMKRSLAESLVGQRRLDDAEAVLLEMLPAIEAAGDHPERTTALEDMIPLLRQVGRDDAAAEVEGLLHPGDSSVGHA